MKRNTHEHFFLGLPTFLWLVIFFAVPMFVVFLLAFKPADTNGTVLSGWTLKHFADVLHNSVYLQVIFRTVWQGVVSTFVCILLAVPICYYIVRLTPKWRNLFLIFMIVPFWINFLVRIFAWKVFLHPDGVFHRILEFFCLVQPGDALLYNQWAVLTVMIYTYLPFAILPIYTVTEQFDFSLLEAAEDLGATKFYAFRKVFLPGISSGILTAVTVVLIPALGAYLIPDLVGGPGSELMGDKIAQRVFTNRNLPLASALSAFLMFIVFVPMLFLCTIKRIHGKKMGKESKQ